MKIKILLIDDDIELTKEVSGFLNKHDYEIKIAGSYAQYSDIFKDYQPEIVLLDLKLPDRSGLDILEEIKSDSPATTVLILSGYGTIDIAVEAIKKGAENFLTKPIDPDHLILLLDKIVKQKQLQNRLLYFRQAPIDYRKQ